MTRPDRLYKLSQGSDTAVWAHDEIIRQQKRIAELERRIRDLEKPQFYMSEGGDFSGGSFCCNHCNFRSSRFADRDEHIKSCEGREEYLSGKTQEQGDE